MRALILRRVRLIETGAGGPVLVGAASLPGHGPPGRLPHAQRASAHGARSRRPIGRGRPPGALRCRAGRPAARRLSRRLGLEKPHGGGARPLPGDGRRRSRQALRRGGRRRRSGGLGSGGLCGVGRPVRGRARRPRLRRAGGRIGAHRELSRFPDRHLGAGARRPRLRPGAEVRRRDRHPDPGRAAALRHQPAEPRTRRRPASAHARRRRGERRRLPPPRRAEPRRASRGGASTTGPRRSKRGSWRARRWRWSAAATRRARPWCSSAATPRVST